MQNTLATALQWPGNLANPCHKCSVYSTSIQNNKSPNVTLQFSTVSFFSTQREPLSECTSWAPSSPVKILYDLKQRWLCMLRLKSIFKVLTAVIFLLSWIFDWVYVQANNDGFHFIFHCDFPLKSNAPENWLSLYIRTQRLVLCS